MVKLCAKIMQIMHSIFEGYSHSFFPIMFALCAPFSQLCATYFAYLKIKRLIN